ncbi:hypothetical protein P691DRAFT_767015 [Macrolepiota fuliginosa MF-IS2]|uniref:Uncharacterized protein n=1 Tax=Macrolepiota fuliginosa MF-IS2 TaxID=1400762 RepID=A0A9P5WXI7_9AGAR|nr:hypothetical protein P691DRAFT_767015 [Macrolepiota fuliginosa MF-IS2]
MKSSSKIIIKPRAPARSSAPARRAQSDSSSESKPGSIKEENKTENDQMDADEESDSDAQNQPTGDDDDEVEPEGFWYQVFWNFNISGPTKKTGKVPKADGEDVSDDEYTPEAEAAPTSAAAAEPEDGTGPGKEASMGGGKPFRKIGNKVHVTDGDEFITEDDPRGDEKIDKWGNLLGGRKFKASTFPLPRHPQRQYMLAIDAARTSGFRDSLYYFRLNPFAFKLNATQPEKTT